MKFNLFTEWSFIQWFLFAIVLLIVGIQIWGSKYDYSDRILTKEEIEQIRKNVEEYYERMERERLKDSQ